MSKQRLFIGTFPTGIAYADREREKNGDYVRLAFLPFRSLKLEFSKARMPPELRQEIDDHAFKIQSRRGELFQVSTSGQTVKLGE